MKRWLFIEAKHPKYDLTRETRYIRQAYQYAHSTLASSDDPLNQVRLAILTDFEEFRLFDCWDSTPLERGNAALLNQYVVLPFDMTWGNYVDDFTLLWDAFERNQVAKGSLTSLFVTRDDRISRRVAPDERFLSDLERWREGIAQSMWRLAPTSSDQLLTAAAQLMIDRLVFVKMLSDREIEKDYLDELRSRLAKADQDQESVSLYDACQDIFRQLDRTYNGAIFARRPELDSVAVENEVMRSLLDDLAPDNATYTLAAMPVEIIGHAYERFLGKTIRSTEAGVVVEEKPEVRKAGGVYYTPRYIVDYIVEQTVGELLKGCQTPEDVAKLRILDPACGSGSFLIGAYDALLRWHERFFEQDAARMRGENRKTLVSPKHKDLAQVFVYGEDSDRFRVRLTTKLRKQILLNNIFGVDIDPQAVEVAQFSLSMKAVEGATRTELRQDVDLFHATVLPDLTANIKWGNSIIAPQQDLLGTVDDMLAIKPFDWSGTAGFKSIMADSRFHAVIGNPPYLNVDDTWGRKDKRLALLKVQYPSVYTDKTDILFYFLAKATELSSGHIAFIVSRAFLEAYKAAKLRSALLSRCHLREVVDFRNYTVFPRVGIATCIVHLESGAFNGEPATAYRLRDGVKAITDLGSAKGDKDLFERIDVTASQLGAAGWNFAARHIASLNATIDNKGIPLSQVCELGQGMQTGRNEVFGKLSTQDIADMAVPDHFVLLRATNSDIDRYFIRARGEHILYLEDAASFHELPQGVQDHLRQHESVLKKRAAHQRGDCEWWRYTWPLHKDKYLRPRVLCPFLAAANRFALDTDRRFLSLTDTTVVFSGQQKEDIRYILALLNSNVLTFRFRTIGKLKGNGLYEYFWNSIGRLPIRRVDWTEARDVETHDRVVGLVDRMMEARLRASLSATSHERSVLENMATDFDLAIESLVSDLYGLGCDERKIIEEECA